ncbi:MAG: hypothetical protein QOG52_2271 [Frankiaceae bacterium]|nr:hypothetical protein [Frankiaceae bacterium]
MTLDAATAVNVVFSYPASTNDPMPARSRLRWRHWPAGPTTGCGPDGRGRGAVR